MNLIIQKYGGTSIGRADRMLNVAQIVQESLKSGHVAVVLSAMSSKVKKEGTTSRLLEAADEAIKGGTYYKIVDLLEERHIEEIKECIKDRSIQGEVLDDVHQEFKRLKSFLDAISVIGEISPRSMDVIVSVGEKLAARIFAGLLNSLGTDAEYVNLEKIIDKDFKEVDREFCLYMQQKIAETIKACGNKVPVLTGFFGYVHGGIIKSIGRGYTDFTAALAAAGCQAQELQIWKEVDGIFSADPNKVPKAKVLAAISPEEAMELTYYGSEVIHPFTMEQVARALVPVRIKNTFNPNLPGTLIDPNDKGDKKHGATAVTVKRNITLVNINSNRMMMAYGFMSRVFEIFARFEIVVDLVSTSEVNISLTLESNQNLEPAIKELEKIAKVSVKKDMAILSLVGLGMRHGVGIAGDMFGRLAKAGVNIEVISQGGSEINISCAVEDQACDKALAAVHQMLE